MNQTFSNLLLMDDPKVVITPIVDILFSFHKVTGRDDEHHKASSCESEYRRLDYKKNAKNVQTYVNKKKSNMKISVAHEKNTKI